MAPMANNLKLWRRVCEEKIGSKSIKFPIFVNHKIKVIKIKANVQEKTPRDKTGIQRKYEELSSETNRSRIY